MSGCEMAQGWSRRRILQRLAQSGAGIGLLLVVGCGTRSGGDRAVARGQMLELVTLGAGGQDVRTQQYLKSWEKETGIQVQLVAIRSYYRQNIHAMVTSGVAPDALFLTRTEFDDLMATKRLLNLQHFAVQESGFARQFFPVAWAEWVRNGHPYALPLGIRVLFVAYSTDLFRENSIHVPPSQWGAPDWTTEDLVAAAKKVSRPATAAQSAHYGFYVEPTYLVYAAFLINAGAAVVNVAERTVDVSGPAVEEMLGQLQSLFTTKGVMPPQDLVAADQGLDLFANGQLGLTVTDPSTIPARQAQAHFVWDVGVLPAEVVKRKTTGTGAGYAILAESRRADDAWKLVNYLVSAPIQRQEARYGQWIPSLPEVATSPVFLPEETSSDLYPQHARLYVDVVVQNRVALQPPLDNWPAVQAALDAAMQGLWTGAQTPAETMVKMVQLGNPVLQRG